MIRLRPEAATISKAVILRNCDLKDHAGYFFRFGKDSPLYAIITDLELLNEFSRYLSSGS